VSRRQALLFIGGAVLLVCAVLAALWLRRDRDSAAPIAAASDEPAAAVVAGSVTLFFPGADGRLHPELRALDTDATGSELARRIVGGVLAGPDTDGLFAPLPPSTEVISVLLADGGTLYLDLGSKEHPRPPVAGSRRELLAAYSLVNSVCNNVPRIRGVVLLWNSEQHTTFAGNLDTTRALTPNRRLVAASS